MHHTTLSLPYSQDGLKALQKTLSLHLELVQPQIWLDPATNDIGIKSVPHTAAADSSE